MINQKNGSLVLSSEELKIIKTWRHENKKAGRRPVAILIEKTGCILRIGIVNPAGTIDIRS